MKTLTKKGIVAFSSVLLAVVTAGMAHAQTGTVHQGIISYLQASYGDIQIISAFPNDAQGYENLKKALQDEDPRYVSVVVNSRIFQRPIDIHQSLFLDSAALDSIAMRFRVMIEGVVRSKAVYSSEDNISAVAEAVSAKFYKTALDQIKSKELVRASWNRTGSTNPPQYCVVYTFQAPKPDDKQLEEDIDEALRQQEDYAADRTDRTRPDDKTPAENFPSRKKFDAVKAILDDDPELSRIMQDYHRLLESVTE
jgi:hypothetical protein